MASVNMAIHPRTKAPVIVYFDTSAVVPLITNEPASATCERLWNEAARVVSVRIMYAEARAALTMAQRHGRLTPRELTPAVELLDRLLDQLDTVEITETLVFNAGAMAQEHSLRGYDAAHLAAALTVADEDTVFVTGDQQLAAAATRLGLAVAGTT